MARLPKTAQLGNTFLAPAMFLKRPTAFGYSAFLIDLGLCPEVTASSLKCEALPVCERAR
jgi:hypothetical protein